MLFSGITVKLWNLNIFSLNEVSVSVKNSTFLKTKPKFLEGMVLEYKDVLFCVEKSNQKYVAVVENSSKQITILYVPSLRIAKVTDLCKVSCIV